MATASRVAKRYAKSLIGLAKEKGALDALFEDMKGVLELGEASRDFELMLASPVVTHEKKLVVLEKIFSGKVHDISMEFFKLITKKSREGVLLNIASEYISQYNNEKGLAIAEVQSAVPLTAALKKEITDKVAKSVNKKIELKEVINEDLIGGFVLRLDDKQIDGSVKSQLLNLKKRLN